MRKNSMFNIESLGSVISHTLGTSSSFPILFLTSKFKKSKVDT